MSSSSVANTVDVSTYLPDEECEALVDGMRQAFHSHLNREPALRGLDLRVRLKRFDIRFGSARAMIDLEGSIDGTPISKTISHKRLVGVENAVGGAVGGAIGGMVAAAVRSAAQAAARGQGGAAELNGCLEECIADAMIFIDQTAGRGKSDRTKVWHFILRARWIAGLLVPCASFLAYKIISGDDFDMAGGIVMSVIEALSLFGTIHLFGLAFMPKSFFLDDPYGQKALARTGVKSILLMRLLAMACGSFISIMLVISLRGLLCI